MENRYFLGQMTAMWHYAVKHFKLGMLGSNIEIDDGRIGCIHYLFKDTAAHIGVMVRLGHL